jgi:hypothetical protein
MKKMRLMPAAGAREAWISAAILFGYAIAMPYAYRGIGTEAGALVLSQRRRFPWPCPDIGMPNRLRPTMEALRDMKWL